MAQIRRLLWGASLTVLAGGIGACESETEQEPVGPEDNPPTIQLSTPTGGEAIQPGADFEITWTATDDIGVTGVDLAYVVGGNESVIATGLTGSSYTWEVPGSTVLGATVRAVAWDSSGQTGEDESEGTFAVIAHSARGYVLGGTCGSCHASYVEDVFASGHPYKLNKVVNGTAPTYPSSSVPSPPPGSSRDQWEDIAYVIGGYGWKARFITADSGWIMTNAMDGVDVQHNLARSDIGGGLPPEWVSYHSTDTERKPYDCGSCHTTGWQSFADNGGVHQDGLVGIAGTWEETGITCEECHGPGATHVASQSASDITVDESTALCGTCHIRGDAATIPASGGYIRHHEQYNELLAGAHTGGATDVGCNDCHDPHVGVLYGNDVAGGIVATCEGCHPTEAANNKHNGRPTCIDCHMPRATKSARANHKYEGDVRTHIFAISTDAAANMFNADSSFVDKGYVTLDFACYSCHTDGSGVGGAFSPRSLQDLANLAQGIHTP